MNILIPAAANGLRRNASKPKIDVEFINNVKLYEHQIELLNKFFPSGQITYILGFHADKVDNELRNLGCDVVYNDDYLNNNVPFGISLAGKLKGALIIYGDIFFNNETLEYLPKEPSGSFIVKDIKDNFHHKNIGVGDNGYLSFCFDNKWTQITYFDKTASSYFNEEIRKPKNYKKFTFEFINEMNNNGVPFDVFCSSGYCKEMDSIKDYNQINKWIFQNENNNRV